MKVKRNSKIKRGRKRAKNKILIFEPIESLIVEEENGCFDFNALNWHSCHEVNNRTTFERNYLLENEAEDRLEQFRNGSCFYIDKLTKELYYKSNDKYINMISRDERFEKYCFPKFLEEE